MVKARKSPIVDSSGANMVAVEGPRGVQYESHQQWLGGGSARSWEAAETNRLNQAVGFAVRRQV